MLIAGLGLEPVVGLAIESAAEVVLAIELV